MSQLQFFKDKLAYEIDPSDLIDALTNGEPIVIIDARKPDAFQRERIPGALNLPHREMNETSTASLNRSALHAVYCDGIGCNASTKGAYNLSKLGFYVKEVIGGLSSWKNDGFATEGEKAFAGQKIECAC
jgi:rhodanese-related sulfurtransferase